MELRITDIYITRFGAHGKRDYKIWFFIQNLLLPALSYATLPSLYRADTLRYTLTITSRRYPCFQSYELVILVLLGLQGHIKSSPGTDGAQEAVCYKAWMEYPSCICRSELSLFGLQDNNIVLGLSTIHTVDKAEDFREKASRRPAKTSTNGRIVRKVFGSDYIKDLHIPRFIDDYNHYMGGVRDTHTYL